MERLQELINQLKEQFEQKAPPSHMLQTARLLEAELSVLTTQAALSKVSANVAVMMPSAMKIYTGQAAMKELDEEKQVAPAAPVLQAVTGKEAAVVRAAAVENESVVEREEVAENKVAVERQNMAEREAAVERVNGSAAVKNGHIVEYVPEVKNSPDARYMPEARVVPEPDPEMRLTPDPAAPVNGRSAAKEPGTGPWPYDPLAEVPTLSQHQPKELNDVIGTNGSSLNDKLMNDKLKSNVLELKSALNDTPVRDLKKAIGINDRFVFINQLFRGDEVMYERSLKTINGFRILPEAEYWMERELKVKLGWDESRDATKQFYQLVRRRFS